MGDTPISRRNHTGTTPSRREGCEEGRKRRPTRCALQIHGRVDRPIADAQGGSIERQLTGVLPNLSSDGHCRQQEAGTEVLSPGVPLVFRPICAMLLFSQMTCRTFHKLGNITNSGVFW